ncbi:translocation protein TolB [uncultured Moraxella sp.]|uniref:translocation protein TolB n=1 Tax=uncultured Moraxella sp. TaxID=263769 RepID=UPI0025F70E30|nr:translocation protein TolB [uncultured Moraxella sp.]
MNKFSQLAIATITVMASISPAIANDDTDKVWVATQQIAQSSDRIAIVPFVGDTVVTGVVTANLDGTELGASSGNLPQRTASTNDILANLSTWRNLGYDYVVIGKSHSIVGNKTAISYDVIDTKAAKVIGSQTQVSDTNTASLKLAGHQISDKIYQAITGKSGDFGSVIAYVEETGTPSNKTSRLKLVDATGQNARTLFTVTGSILTPTFSPDGSRIAYAVQAKNGLPVIHVQSINGTHSEVVTPFWGHNLAPSFSADGTRLLFSGSHEYNNPNIYELNLTTKTLKAITTQNGAENSPSYLPDGSGFIYTADNGTRSQSLYRYQFANQNATRIALNATNPHLSHDGSKIAYVAGQDIIIANVSGSTLQRIKVGGTEISASFSPSANRIVYAQSQGGQSKLVIHNLTSNQSTTLPTTGQVREPVWSK